MPKNLSRLLTLTDKPEGELKLLLAAITGREEGVEWMDMVRRGLAGDRVFRGLVERPLVRLLGEITSSVMAPEVDNFVSTPWGGTRIAAEMKRGLGRWPKDKVVGESWEISGHPKSPNKFRIEYAGTRIPVDMGTLGQMFSKNLFGSKDNEVAEMPFLVKFLNSGSWKGFISELSSILSELDEREEAGLWRRAVGAQTTLQEVAGRNYDQVHRDISLLEKLILEPILGVSNKHPKAGAWREGLGVDDLRDIMQLPGEQSLQALAKLAELQQGTGFTQFIWTIREVSALHRLHQQMLAKNLSVQVHPTAGFKGLAEGEHPKTEAWIVIGAEEGAVIYLGLRDGVTKEVFAEAANSGGDLTTLLNPVPLSAGGVDIFFVPGGTEHAIGAGVLLVEPQQSSGTTYRAYDYGRLDDKGNPRELHIDQVMAVTDWDGLRGEAAVEAMRRRPVEISRSKGVLVESLIDESDFRTDRITLDSGGEHHGDPKGIEGYTVLDGAVRVIRERDGRPQGEFFKGQSFIVPAAVGAYTIEGSAGKSVLIEIMEANR